MRMASIRWAFNFGSWKPTRNEWLFAARCIQQEEKERIGKFIFTKDCKASMAGRLLIRKVITDQLKMRWHEVQLARTDRGKPYLASQTDKQTVLPNFNFNASHQGNFAVLAAEPDRNCGIDVMSVDRPGSQDITEFFRLMQKQFTPHEWCTIKAAGTEWQQLEMFYRHWCLKESYVKAVGTGLGISLQRLEFHLTTLVLDPNTIVMDTKLYFDGSLLESWSFQETKLDDKHYVAVALNREHQGNNIPAFQFLTFTDLMASAEPILPEDHEYWNSFASKQERPMRQNIPR